MSAIVHTIDLEYLGVPGSIAAYLVEAPGGPLLVETGPANTTAALARGLAAHGYAPTDVRHVLVTHIHFDHAGAAWWMARHGARIWVHAFGRGHLVDPARLVASATRIYGDRMHAMWGAIEGIPDAQAEPVDDGDVLDLEGTRLRAIETPGHARHHHSFALDTDDGRVVFTGDAGGTFIADCPRFIAVPTPPPEFQLGAWLASIERLQRLAPARLYPTHFGPVDDPAAHLQRLGPTLREHALRVRRLMAETDDRDAITRRYTDWFVESAIAAGVPERRLGFYVRDTIAAMNVTGILRYWTKLDELFATATP